MRIQSPGSLLCLFPFLALVQRHHVTLSFTTPSNTVPTTVLFRRLGHPELHPTAMISRPLTKCHLTVDSQSLVETTASTVTLVSSSSSYYDHTTQLLLAETVAWVQPTALILDPILNFMSLAMLLRVVLSWYPTQNVSEFPWIVAVLPTEPLLKSVRGIVPPAFGVDITPIVWLGFFTFVHEILLGQQGLLTLKLKYGI